MKVEIDDKFIGQLQSYTTLPLTNSDFEFLAQCFFDIGLLTVDSVLEKHPELTFRELLMMYFRKH
ncbi:MAG: hypothetical protein ABL933_02830 [Methyloglobulus sp.]|nr:hypothetical protein [Methyloglobulus sp.]